MNSKMNSKVKDKTIKNKQLKGQNYQPLKKKIKIKI